MVPGRRRRTPRVAAAAVGAAALAVVLVTRTAASASLTAAPPLGPPSSASVVAAGTGAAAWPDAHDEVARLVATALAASDTPSAWTTPVRDYRITARFGEKGRHWETRHTGLDFKAPWGAPVYAVHDGTVVKLAHQKAYGVMVILEISPGVTLWYCHLSQVLVHVGPVTAGQMIGRIGATGNASGPHLHLEVRVDDRPTDPDLYLFGFPPGTPGPVPSWLPPVPVLTVATLPPLRH